MTQDHPCNCKTCSKKDCWYHPSRSDENEYGCNNSAWAHSKRFGCLSHSDARQFLMKGVIQVLELETIDQRNLQSRWTKKHSEIHKKIADVLEYTIIMIKNGVEEP